MYNFEMECLCCTCIWECNIYAQMIFAGGFNDTLCGIVQYTNLYGTAIGYTIAGAISMMWVINFLGSKYLDIDFLLYPTKFILILFLNK